MPERRAESDSAAASCPIVGLGASAGGLESFQQFLQTIPADSGLAYVLVQHLSPDYASNLTSILGRCTKMPVLEIDDDMAIEADHVYVIPPNASLTMSECRLRLSPMPKDRAFRTPIDTFFRSLAEDQEENAACVILSGSGSDGTLGMRAVKEHGGLTIAQTGETVKYDGMMRSAVATGLIDLVLPIEEMPERLIGYFRKARPPSDAAGDKPEGDVVTAVREAIPEITRLLHQKTGNDFSQYKYSTLVRRIQRRMQVLQFDEPQSYIEVLKKDGQEANLLFHDLLIGVTRFFRDPECFTALEKFVIPDLFKDKGSSDRIRVWVPGCATGEEAYSLAMLLSEHQPGGRSAPRIQIFATDIDVPALDIARLGRYPAAIADDLSPARLERFFIAEDGSFRVNAELREMCVFSPHNILRDPPFSRLDLISCRNLLIYLEADLQKRLVPLFHYGLKENGFLFLGTAESVSHRPDLFATVDKTQRIFQTLDGRRAMPAFPIAAAGGRPALNPAGAINRQPMPRRLVMTAVERLVMDEFAPPFVVVNERLEILLASPRTGKYLQLAPGAPDNNVVSMAREGLRMHLRSALHDSISTGRPVFRRGIAFDMDGGRQTIDLSIRPIRDSGDGKAETDFAIVFRDVGEARRVEEDDARRDLEDGADDENVRELERELLEARDLLQTTTEDLEGANEELKSSNEELSSMNEELQSANEELETSKEELQSINEELQTVNNELNTKVEELSSANNDMKNYLENTQIAMLFLDNEMKIRSFTPAVRDLFYIVESDTGRHVREIKSQMAEDFPLNETDKVLRTLNAIERQVSSADGSSTYIMRILPYRTIENAIKGVVVTFVDVTAIKSAETEIRSLNSKLQRQIAELEVVLDVVPIGILTCLDPRCRNPQTNRRGAEILGDQIDLILGDAGSDTPLRRAAAEGRPVVGVELSRTRKDGSTVDLLVSAMPLMDENDKVRGAVCAFDDITERKRAARQQARLAAIADASFDAIIGTDANAVITSWNRGAEQAYGYSAEEAVGRPVSLIAPPDTAADLTAKLAGLHQLEGMQHFELQRISKSGKAIPVSSTVTPIYDSGGALSSISIIDHDMSHHIEAKRQQDILLSELNHRVKNTLAVVGSLAAQTLKTTGPGADFVDAFQGRLQALGKAHSLVTEGKWVSVKLAAVVDQELAPFHEEASERVSATGPVVSLTPKAALALSLVFHELCANTSKYGALSVPEGKISVRWWLEGEVEDRQLMIEWVESGGPPVTAPGRKGLGRKLIEMTVPHELTGTASLDFSPEGVVCRMALPAEHFHLGAEEPLSAVSTASSNA